MPRKPRIFSSSGIYHVILRSVNQHIIFENDSDYQKFLFILSDCKTNFDIDIYAYCLMDNHIHILLHSSDEDLSHFFQCFETRFARWYNKKYERSGHLFQDRFFSAAIESSSKYLTTLTYIHNNPVKASVCRFPSEYRWSSYNAFYGQKNPLINVSYSYDIAGSKDSLLVYFANVNISSDPSDSFAEISPQRKFISDEKALIIFKKVTQLSSTSKAADLKKTLRNEYIRTLRKKGLTINQVARLMDVSVATVKRLSNLSQ